MMLKRGILFWDHKNNQPLMSSFLVERLALAVSFALFAVMIGLQKDSGDEKQQLHGIIRSLFRYFWHIDKPRGRDEDEEEHTPEEDKQEN